MSVFGAALWRNKLYIYIGQYACGPSQTRDHACSSPDSEIPENDEILYFLNLELRSKIEVRSWVFGEVRLDYSQGLGSESAWFDQCRNLDPYLYFSPTLSVE